MTDWDRILREHAQAVWRTAYRLLGNSQDAEECLQEVFLSVWQLSCREPIRNWSGVLKRLATARALDRLRLRMRHIDENGSPASLETLASSAPGPDRLAEENELAERLRLALAELSPGQAEVFCLCCLEDMKYREAAEVMGIEPNAAAVLLHRARKSLREMLSGIVGEK